MRDNTRIIVNTLAQNVRTILNILMSLYSTRLVMEALGESDYGIYMLVSGFVFFLSYFSNALVITTQRHLSYSFGQGNMKEAKSIFSNSYLLHWIFGACLALIMVSLTWALFNGSFLEIDPSKLGEAKFVYLLMIATVLFSFVSSPYRALLIAHENIVYISIVDVLDGVLKLSLAFLLFFVDHYRLPLYAVIMCGVMLFNFVALAGYSILHYQESCLIPSLKECNKRIMKLLINFVTWTLYGMVCVFLRSQGIAVILNRAFGTIINAAYGVATQVFGSTQFLSESILNAMKPQIIKAEGGGNHERMLFLCEAACKYCFLIISMVSIPLIWEMPGILKFWLGNVPDHAALFCRIMLLSALLDNITMGLSLANSAMGRIRNYTVLIFTIKFLTVPAIGLALYIGWDVKSAMLLYVLFEFLSAIARAPYLAKTAGVNLFSFTKNVLLRVLLPVLALVSVGYLMCQLPDTHFRFLLTGCLSVIVGIVVIWFAGLRTDEREYVLQLVRNRIRK